MTEGNRTNYRLAVVITHPIQYQAPIFRELSKDPKIELTVFFASDESASGGIDAGFGVPVSWDIPLLEGYSHRFLRNWGVRFWSQSFLRYNCPSLLWELPRGHFDAVLLLSYSTAILDWQAIFMALVCGIPILIRPEGNDCVHDRGHLKDLVRYRMLAFLYRRVSAFLAIGSLSKDHYLKHAGRPENIYWSPYCVDNEFFRSRAEKLPSKAELKKALGFKEDQIVALFCGKLIAKKAPLLLAEALHKLRHKGRISLLVVGDGVLRREMEESVSRSGIEGFLFAGFQNQSELPRYYKAADFMILPSAFGETWGLVANEAMNFGLPVVVSDRVGCSSDLVQNDETGYTFPTGSADMLADVIDRMLTQPGKISEMGEKAKKLISGYGVDAAVSGIKRALVERGRRGQQRKDMK